MTVQTCWDNENRTIIRTEFVGAWTWDETYVVVDQMLAMMASVDYTVHIIVDLTNSHRIPPFAFREVRGLLSRRSPNAGMAVIVGTEFIASVVWKTLEKPYEWLINNKYSFAASVEDARARLAALTRERR